MLHRTFHAVFFVAFVAALGAAFLGLAMPLLFKDRKSVPMPAIWVLLGLAAVAVGALALDWLLHTL